MAQAKEKETHYKMITGELITLIQELRIRKETLVPQYLLRMVQAELSFFKAAAEMAERIETELLEIGQVQPVPFLGLPGYTNLSEEQTFETFGTVQTQTTYQPPPSLPPQTFQPSYPQAKAVYPFAAQNDQELSFVPGDILTILSRDGDWWRASMNGREGLIPSNYIQMLS